MLLRKLFFKSYPDLTIGLIRDNPWHAIYCPLPAAPSKSLLGLALMAADYCRSSERFVAEDFRKRCRADAANRDRAFEDEMIHIEQSVEITHDAWRDLQMLYEELGFYFVP